MPQELIIPDDLIIPEGFVVNEVHLAVLENLIATIIPEYNFSPINQNK